MVLDTNVVSELLRPTPSTQVMQWLNAQSPDDLWLNGVVVSELLFGLARLPAGSRKRQLTEAFAAMLSEDFAGRVLPFDLEAAVIYAELSRAGRPAGDPLRWPMHR